MKKSIRALKSWLFTPGNKAARFSRAAEVHFVAEDRCCEIAQPLQAFLVCA